MYLSSQQLSVVVGLLSARKSRKIRSDFSKLSNHTIEHQSVSTKTAAKAHFMSLTEITLIFPPIKNHKSQIKLRKQNSLTSLSTAWVRSRTLCYMSALSWSRKINQRKKQLFLITSELLYTHTQLTAVAQCIIYKSTKFTILFQWMFN